MKPLFFIPSLELVGKLEMLVGNYA